MSGSEPNSTGHVLIKTGPLAPGALEAAATFYERFSGAVARAIADGATSVALSMPAATYDHTDWRRTAARDLARQHTPARVNVVGGDDPAAIEKTSSYLAGAQAITGQYLPLEDTGADVGAGSQGD